MAPYWLIAFFLMVSGNLFANEKIIIFNMTESGYPPFMINEKDKLSRGIIYDVLHLILSKHGYVIRTIQVPKNRELEFFKTEKLDAHAMAKEWVDEPSEYEFSDPILKVRNVLFSNVDSPVAFTKIEDLVGKKAITHLGYKYPPLTTYFNGGLIERNDTVDETAMLAMVLAKRGDFTIVNDFVGTWIIQQRNWSYDFYISKRAITSYDYRIMFAKKWKLLVRDFNKELALLKENGELEKIIDKYVETATKKDDLLRNLLEPSD